MYINHGSYWCFTDDTHKTRLTIENVVDTCIDFLKANPTETIVMHVDETISKHAKDGKFTQSLFTKIGDQNLTDYFYMENRIPALDEARGKIVFARRYHSDAGEGLDFTGWKSGQNESFIYPTDWSAIIQDNYTSLTITSKKKVVSNFISNVEKGDYDKYSIAINCCNATNFGHGYQHPWQYATEINKMISLEKGHRYGWTWLDFCNYYDYQAVKQVINSNYFLTQLSGLSRSRGSEQINFVFREDSIGDLKPVQVKITYTEKSTGVVKSIRIAYPAGDEYKQFAFPNSLLNPNSLYQIDIVGIDASGKKATNELSSQVTIPLNKPVLTLPSTIASTDTDLTASINVNAYYSYKSIDVTLNDGSGAPLSSTTLQSGATSPIQVNFPWNPSLVGQELSVQLDVHFDDQRATASVTSDKVKFSPAVVPVPVIDDALLNPGYDSLDVAWSTPVGSPTVDSFLITLEHGNEKSSHVVPGDTFSWTAQYLKSATPYSIRVFANISGVYCSSESVVGTTAAPPKLALAPRVSYAPNAQQPIPLEATLDMPSDIDRTTLTYDWWLTNEFGGFELKVADGVSDTFEAYPSATNTSAYCEAKWKVVGDYSTVYSSTSNKIIIYAPPGQPQNLSIKRRTLSSVDLSWDRVEGASMYLVAYIDNAGISHEVLVPLMLGPSGVLATINGLDPGTTYTFDVYAINTAPLEDPIRSPVSQISGSTLQKAEAPVDPEITRSPEQIASYTTDIVFSAKASLPLGQDIPPEQGVLSYQWQIADNTGVYQDMSGETSAVLTIVPGRVYHGKIVRCLITNTLNETTASVFTEEHAVLFMGPKPTDVRASHTKDIGAISVEVEIVNPECADAYEVTATPLVARVADTNVRIIPAQGSVGETTSMRMLTLEPGTLYEISVGSLLKDPLTGEYSPIDQSQLTKTQITTLPGAQEPLITDATGDLSVKGGASVDLRASVTAPSVGHSVFEWDGYPRSDWRIKQVLSEGKVTGTQVANATLSASDATDGYQYQVFAQNINNGDNKVGTSNPGTLQVMESNQDQLSQTKDHSWNLALVLCVIVFVSMGTAVFASRRR